MRLTGSTRAAENSGLGTFDIHLGAFGALGRLMKEREGIGSTRGLSTRKQIICLRTSENQDGNQGASHHSHDVWRCVAWNMRNF